MSMNKTIVLIRHAHRDTEDRLIDNGLTEKGKKQARKLGAFYSSRFPKKDFAASDVLLLTSPKKRCVETLGPIQAATGFDLQLSDRLLEARVGESFDDVSERVNDFLSWWKSNGPALTLVCSHGDWLPIAVHQILGSVVYFKKGSWLEMDWVSDQAHLRWYVPSFKHLGD